MAAFDVIIVGAGPAGIAAGCRLLAKGVNRIALLEAEDRVGGRIHSVPFGDGIVDLGAQFCHGEKGNVVYDMAHPLNLLESTMSLHSSMGFVESTGHMVDEDIGSWLLDVCLDITDDAGENLKNYKHSLGEYVTAEFNKRVKAEGAPKNLPVALQESFLEWFHRFENSYDGSDSWFETSGSGQTEYIDCEGDPELVWKDGGFKKVLDLLMNKFPDPSLALPLESKIYFRKVVNKIEWNHTDHGKVTILCQDGSEFQADRVVVTVSLGVLKANSQELFVPPLPQGKLNVINGLAIGAVDKIFLKFPETWWPEDIHGFSLIWTKADYDQFLSKYGEDADVGQPGVLCGWISGPGARAMEACSEQEVQEGCEEILHQFLGRMYKIPKIQALSRSQWSSNPYFRGSYSFRSMKSEEMKVKAKDLAEPLENNNHKKVLLFAGEATHQYFYSTVHGAIETGWREADRIIKYLTHNK